VEDYNHRRINFSHLCMVELEAFGLFENPRMNSYPALQRSFSAPAQELGRMVLDMKEMADMEFLAVGGERIPVNSRIIARRWGAYFLELLNAANKELPSPTARPSTSMTASMTASANKTDLLLPTPAQFNPIDRPRTLYLPHTQQTLLTLVHYLYTSTLPPPNHAQSSPQILCSLLQIARPYRVEGLLEAVVERLHQVLDGKNAAAVFNAAAMAAGGGNGGNREEDPAGSGDEWRGGVSSVIGLQKRGLRGLMEGRRMRERGRSMGGRGGEGPTNQGTFGVGVGAS
jgi:hypothetical protein